MSLPSTTQTVVRSKLLSSMESNHNSSGKRASARWAKENAEKRFRCHDFKGAFKSACIAKDLFPSLDGVDQILAAYEVHAVAATAKKINGEMDWNAVLGVDSSAELETIRKQYKKKALLVHPDKNQSSAADGAFKLISDAWKSLSSCSSSSAVSKKAAAAHERGHESRQEEEKKDDDDARRRKYPSALWAKDKAEKSFKSGDLKGALDCADIAKDLYPSLDDIDKFIAAYEIHWAAATKKINGRTDWYAVLGVNSSVGLEDMKKEYKRRVLLVHPDKNASAAAAAAGAFELVTEALNTLSKAV